MSSVSPPTFWRFVWCWAWWSALLLAVPVQAIVVGSVYASSIPTFRSVGRPIGSPPGTPPAPTPPGVAAGDSAYDYLGWLPVVQIVMAAVAVILPNRPVRSALGKFRLWVWVPFASVLFAWVGCQAGRSSITSPPL